MPEGPEHFKAASLINKCCCGCLFSGKVIKSIVNKNPEITFNVKQYTIYAKARGKELMITLTESLKDCIVKTKGRKACVNKVKTDCSTSKVGVKQEQDNESEHKLNKKNEEKKHSPQQINIVIQFGMSGKFEFTKEEDIHKHAHLMFFTDKENMVLSYVDTRRFGKWRIDESWSEDRGPDPVFEYSEFRKNVLGGLEEKVFSKAICEVLHNQKYFNGIGNYLRAEILYRSGTPPFEEARSVLEKLEVDKKEPCCKEKGDNNIEFDLLDYCSIVPNEVMMLKGVGYDPSDSNSDYSLFQKWLQCYNNPVMDNLIDHDGRTIWFQGQVGILAPKGEKSKSRHVRKSKKIKNDKTTPAKKVKADNTGTSKKEDDVFDKVIPTKKAKKTLKIEQHDNRLKSVRWSSRLAMQLRKKL